MERISCGSPMKSNKRSLDPTCTLPFLKINSLNPWMISHPSWEIVYDRVSTISGCHTTLISPDLISSGRTWARIFCYNNIIANIGNHYVWTSPGRTYTSILTISKTQSVIFKVCINDTHLPSTAPLMSRTSSAHLMWWFTNYIILQFTLVPSVEAKEWTSAHCLGDNL